MAFSRARYVSVCQQFLVTATVSALAVTAAGVVTLDIVAPDAGAGSAAPDLAPAVHMQTSYVDNRPVNPTVHQVALRPTAASTQPTGGSSAGEVRGSARAARATGTGSPAATAVDHVKGLPVVLTSPPEAVGGLATVGVTWAHGVNLSESQVAVQVRTLKQGVWSAWQSDEYHTEHAPDPGEPGDAHDRPGTDPLLVGHVDRVQMRIATASGQAPRGLHFDLINPGKDHLVKQTPAIDTAQLPAGDQFATSSAPIERTAQSSATGGSSAGGSIALSAMRTAPKPYIYSRSQWGANEHLREQSKPDYGTIKLGFVHHTVNANNYTKADVPALIRGIYAYHVISRGWRDIGYNFLIDRFGRIWEGRWGGVDRAVVGAQTLNYNYVSFGAAAIGNFQIAEPPQAVLNAYAALFAWKLSLYNIKATASGLQIKGRSLHAISGHRDAYPTECPGKYLYAKLPWIRTAAYKIQQKAQTGAPAPTPTPTPTPSPTPTGYNPLGPAKHMAAQPPGITFPSSTNLAGSHWPDLAVQDDANALSVLRTGGMVGYQAPVSSAGPWSQMNSVVATGDITGDHSGDVLARRKHSWIWQIYRGDGHGHIASTPIDNQRRFRKVVTLIDAHDFDGDHRSDLLGVDRQNHALYLYRGLGPLRWASRKWVAPAWNRFTKTVYAGDLNGDGHPDLAALGRNHELYVVYGHGDGWLSKPVPVAQLGTTYNSLVGGGDLTGDGIGDLLLRYRHGGDAVIWPGNGHGGFTQPLGPFPQLRNMGDLTSAMLMNGGRADAIGVRGNVLEVMANNNRRNLLAPISSRLTTKAASAIYDVGDWNGDGIADIVTRQDNNDELVLHLGLGGGRFRVGIIMAKGFARLGHLAAVGDVTGDGHPDLMGKTPHGAMRIFPGNGKHGFGPPLYAPTTMRTFNQLAGTSWLDHSTPESLMTSSDRSFVPFAGQPLDSGTAALRSAGNVSLSDYDWLIGPGDVNGDGIPDLLARQRSDGTLWLIPGTATGFGPRMFVGGGLGKYRLAG